MKRPDLFILHKPKAPRLEATDNAMKITCDDLSAFVDAYIDDEFDERDRAEFEAHLAYCDSCRREVDEQIAFTQHFKKVMRASEPTTPEHLKHNILSMLEQQVSESQAKQEQARRKQLVNRAGMAAAPIAATLALALMLPAFTVAPASSAPAPIAAQAVDWHHGDFPLEIQDSNPQAVTQWFEDKVSFPVRLPQLAGMDATLVGGRLAQIQDRRAALVLYELEDGSRMSVMMFDGQGLEVPGDRIKKLGNHDVALLRAKGYEVAVMQERGLTYSLTSDLNEDDFVSLMKASLTP